MEQGPQFNDAEILAQVIAAFNRLDPVARERIYETIGTFFELRKRMAEPILAPPSVAAPLPSARPSFSTDREPSPKEFLLEKQPRTDVERVACLAFYLFRYRNQPEFSNLDISKLNTEAAQRKFANAAYTVANAVKMGYLAPAAKGARQISGPGERFVEMLPDHEGARAVMAAARPRRRQNRKSGKPEE